MESELRRDEAPVREAESTRSPAAPTSKSEREGAAAPAALIVPVNQARVLRVIEWPTGVAGTVVLEISGAVVVAYAGDQYRDYPETGAVQVRLPVYTGPTIDTSPVKRPNSFMQCYRMAWRESHERRMVRDGWNMTVPDLVAWGDVEGLSEFGVVVSVHGVRFEVQMEDAVRNEFAYARRYAFRGGLHAVLVET